MSTLLKLLLLPPDLLKSHAQAYADMVGELTARYLRTFKNRWVMYALSALALWLTLVFSGVALMLWSVVPLQTAPYPWVLLALPAGTLGLSAFCWWWARRLRLPPVLKDIQTQIQLDLQLLRQTQTT